MNDRERLLQRKRELLAVLRTCHNDAQRAQVLVMIADVDAAIRDFDRAPGVSQTQEQGAV